MDSLREFITCLEKKELLIRTDKEVSTQLEMTQIHKRLIEQGGKAILFENVVTENGKSNIPVLLNLFGTKERIALGMNLDNAGQLRELGQKLAFLKHPEPPANMSEAFAKLPLLKDVMAMKPKLVKKAPCQYHVYQGNDIDLSKLPIQTCWNDEPAPLITWSVVATKGKGNSKTDSYNLGVYRMQVAGKNKALMRWLKHRGGAEHSRGWQEKGRK